MRLRRTSHRARSCTTVSASTCRTGTSAPRRRGQTPRARARARRPRSSPSRTETARCRTACVRTPRARRAPGGPKTRACARRSPGARRKRPRRAARPPRRRARTRAATRRRETRAGKRRRSRRGAVAHRPRPPLSPSSRLPSPRRAAGSTRTARRIKTTGPARARRAPPGPNPACEAATCAAASGTSRTASMHFTRSVSRFVPLDFFGFFHRVTDGLMTPGKHRSESSSTSFLTWIALFRTPNRAVVETREGPGRLTREHECPTRARRPPKRAEVLAESSRASPSVERAARRLGADRKAPTTDGSVEFEQARVSGTRVTRERHDRPNIRRARSFPGRAPS